MWLLIKIKEIIINNLKYIFTFISLLSFLILAIGSTDDSSSSSKTSSKSSSKSKYTGYYNGNWEGFVLNQYNKGSASFDVSSNGSATLRLNGSLSATHKGKVRGDKFITTNGKSCSIVDMGSGFKIVLIWTSVNIDVNFY